MPKLTIEPAAVYQRYMQYRSLGYCALIAYLHTFNRRLEIDWGRAIATMHQRD